MPRAGETPRPLPTPLYCAAVAALSFFFVGLTIGHAPIDGYMVSAEVAIATRATNDPGKAGTNDRSRLPTQSFDLQQIANAARGAERQVHGESDDGAGRTLSAQRLREIVQNLDLQMTGQTGSESRVTLKFRGKDLDWSVALLDHLSRQFLIRAAGSAPRRGPSDESIRQARWIMDQSRHYERKARYDLEDALNTHFELLNDPPESRSGTAIASLARSAGGGQAASAPEPNPQWERLQDELSKLTDQLGELFQTVTPSHPRAQHIGIQIEQLQHELAATPKYLDDPSQHRRASAIEPAAGAAHHGMWDPRPAAFASQQEPPWGTNHSERTDAAAYHQMREQHDRAMRQREAAEQRFGELVTLQQAESSVNPSGAGGLTRPASLVRQIGGRPGGRRVSVVGLLALACGAAMFWRVRSLRNPPPINPLEAQQTAPLSPLASWVSVDATTSFTRRRSSGGSVERWCVRLGEIVLVAMLILFLISVLSDGAVAREMADNPLGTFVHRVAAACGI